MIDTHVHLNDEAFADNLDYYIQNAIKTGVNKMIVVGYDQKSSQKALEIAHEYPFVYASVGIHPSEVNKLTINDTLDWLRLMLSDPKTIAIGEIGLDYHWDTSFKELQKEYLIKQILIANEYKIPIIVHTRDASNETFQIIKEYAKVRGIIHCFSGSYEMAKEYVKLGFLLGIGGVVTFKNTHLKEVVAKIPLEYLVSETDAPYLAPVPYRGRQNEPKYIKLIIEEISKIKVETIENIEKKMEENVYQLFGI